MLTIEEEQSLIAHVIAVSVYGFPVTAHDMRFIVKAYLDKRGKKVKCFKDNFPGKDWVTSFLDRHRQVLVNRVARNISVSRAAVNHEIINNFFDHLEREVENVPPSNIWNYDETNLGDDPGATKVLIRRGTKYPEQIRNATKACTSLMICGNAAGEIAPVYVVYKSENLWQSWTENGPENCRYNRTKSGWFDYQCFEDWFNNTMLPILRRQDGKKILIGDNLSSHLNIEVIRRCEKYNISFIALPPNATHLVQPLDVAFFRPMKGKWREILHAWKDTTFGSRCGTIPKDMFPRLLKQLMDAINERLVDILPAGFRKTGIYPLNRAEVLSRMPEEIMDNQGTAIKEALGNSFLEQIQKKRDSTTALRQCQRRKKVNVPPGRSISAADVAAGTASKPEPKKSILKHKNSPLQSDPVPSTSNQPMPSTSRHSEIKEHSNKKLRGKSRDSDSETSEDSVAVTYRESDMSPMSEFDNIDDDTNAAVAKDDQNPKIGHYAIIQYEGSLFPGVITKICDDGVTVSAMEKCGAHWKWPERKDELVYEFCDIIQPKINTPTQISRREIFRIPEMDVYI